MRSFLRPAFLIHLWTLAGLAFAMLAVQQIVLGDLDAAVRWLLLVLLVDHTDGTLARKFRLAERIPEVSGETIDLITDVIGLTFVPMVFLWRAGAFLPGFGAPLAAAAATTCSLKYSMKARLLREGVSHGAPPADHGPHHQPDDDALEAGIPERDQLPLVPGPRAGARLAPARAGGAHLADPAAQAVSPVRGAGAAGAARDPAGLPASVLREAS